MTLGSKENYTNAVATKRDRRKATWFNMQKHMVNNYALGILVLKVTTTPQDSYFDRITESHRDRPTT
jgi:hypothetical protein